MCDLKLEIRLSLRGRLLWVQGVQPLAKPNNTFISRRGQPTESPAIATLTNPETDVADGFRTKAFLKFSQNVDLGEKPQWPRQLDSYRFRAPAYYRRPYFLSNSRRRSCGRASTR